jgi:ParB family chromosome partitioning protein
VEKKALGKGLKALIGEPEDFARYESSLPWRQIGIDEIDPNPRQPREGFDPEKLEALVGSIRSNGILQPIIVRRAGERYQIIAGERRWRAARLANMLSIPAIVRDADDQHMLTIALIENLQRQDLTPIEEALAYRTLLEEQGLTQELLGRVVGKDRSTVANLVRLLLLPEEIQGHVSRGTLSMGHARALLGLSEPGAQLELCRRALEEGLSVRQVELLVKSFGRRRVQKKATPDPDIRRLEEDLQRALGTKVRLRRTGKRGRIEIEFYSNDELEALLSRLLHLGGKGMV